MSATPSQNSLPSFDEELCGLVLDTAPRQFAVVQVYDTGGQDADGWVAAWGFADGDGVAHLLVVEGRTRMTLASPERALCLFSGRPGLSARLVWLARSGAAALGRAEAA
ncbi:hypothetical protein [Kitasatospora purpeofusca]|uniref:hypothetical protein n=1 Tax=Kitasatospora purpeofusca TaxID=67352 RepID=UPI002A5A3A3F|nr:hypothetical protein [Kitasatospora purpeofusca]MDY0812612.1 hypothetical protein [Kitasatospora purpeofusca]